MCVCMVAVYYIITLLYIIPSMRPQIVLQSCQKFLCSSPQTLQTFLNLFMYYMCLDTISNIHGTFTYFHTEIEKVCIYIPIYINVMD